VESVHRNDKSISALHTTKKVKPMCNNYKCTGSFVLYECTRVGWLSSHRCIIIINASVLLSYMNAPMRFDSENTGKKTSATTFDHPIFFSYMEHLLKPLLQTMEVIAEFF
jgi:hypothetical protein